MNGVGEPFAGKPHARFEAAGAGNGADLTTGTWVAQPTGKPAEERPGALPSASHRASPRFYTADLWVIGVSAIERAPDLGQ